VQSKFHWWSHYYVSSIRIRNGRIDLYFRFPEKYREDTRVEAFRNKVCESVRDQFLEVYDIFDRHGIRLYRDIRIKEEKYISDGVLEPIPGDLSEYINENVLKITESSQKLSAATGAAWFVDGVAYSDDAEVVNCLNNVINLVAESRNLDAAGEVKRCRTLMMPPKERMIFSSIAGNCCYIIGELIEAKKYYEDALNIAKRRDLQEIHKEATVSTRAATLGNIGLIYSARGDLDNALRYHEDALVIHREIGYIQGEANQLGNIGLIYIVKGDLNKALEYHQEALKIHRGIGYRYGEAVDLGNIGVIYKTKGDLNKALEYHQEALKIRTEIGYRQDEASDLGNIGLIYKARGDLDNALRYLEDALVIDREIGYRQGEANQLGNIGLIYSDKGDLDNALRYLEDALAIFDVAAPQMVVQSLNNIATIYFEKESYEKGFECLARAILASASIEQFNKIIFHILRIVREMVTDGAWKHLEKIHSIYTSGIITDVIWLNFFTAIHEYAMYRQTDDESHDANYKSAQQKLDPAFKKLLDELLEVGK
jgi:tetratricopeptide (TPR) repeat protein